MRTCNRRDEGFAMVAVIGAVALITIVAVGGYFLSSSALDESQRVQAETRAFQVAQSGLDSELAVFNPVNLDTSYYPKTGSTSDGDYVIEVEAAGGGGFEYIMTVTGTADGRSESVTMRFYYLNLWDMNIGAGDSASIQGGRGWNGQGTIIGPLYTRGDVHLGANSHYEEGPLFIHDGNLYFDSGSAGMGEDGDVDLYLTGAMDPPGKDIHIGNVSSSVPDIVLPWVDGDYLDAMLERAIDESTDNYMGAERRTIVNEECISYDPSTYETVIARSAAPGASTYYKVIGAGTTRGGIGEGTHDLTVGSTSFGAWEGNGYAPGSGLHDDFAFDAGSGTLYVEGTVFVDGDLTLGTNVTSYVGNGTLVVNGDVIILGYLQPKNGISTTQALGITTPGNVDIGPRDGGGNGGFTGAIFANGEVGLYGSATSAHGTWYEGSILCGNIYGDMPNMELRTDPTNTLSQVLPESMPAAGGGMVFNGTWSRQ